MGLDHAFKWVFMHKLSEMQTVLFDYIENVISKRKGLNAIQSCGEIAIILNHRAALEHILQCVTFDPESFECQKCHKLSTLCNILKREELIEIMRKFANDDKIGQYEEQVKQALHLLIDNYELLKDEIKSILYSIPVSQTKLDSVIMEVLQSYIEFPVLREMGASIVKTLFDCGGDIDSLIPKGKHIVSYLVERLHKQGIVYIAETRSFIERILYENPNYELCETVSISIAATLNHAWKVDVSLNKSLSTQNRQIDHISGRHTMDNKEHTYSGHEGQEYVYNFFLPLLIESGFPLDRQLLVQARSEALHETEVDFIEQCLDKPRPLMHRCRDVLRKHYRGRRIHDLVNTMDIPVIIRDFVLLKDILLSCTE